MYLSGIPAGMLIDAKGPRISIMISIVSLFIGYYMTYWGMTIFPFMDRLVGFLDRMLTNLNNRQLMWARKSLGVLCHYQFLLFSLVSVVVLGSMLL